ncbi:enolase-phosphatase E1, partial [Sodiomyces alkalinus F11]
TKMSSPLASVRVVLLDIEGTVCPISFVKDILFPYSLQALPETLDKNWDTPEFASYRNAFPEPAASSRTDFEAHVVDLVNRDVKAPYLKALQGYLWKRGYESGQIKAPLFPDVAPTMAAWVTTGMKVMIYSSGSVPAQKLLFGHTDSSPSSLIPLISDWFDTVNAGPKTESRSYAIIMSHHPNVKPHEWLFLSDNLAEVSAAREAGMQSLPVVRPGNAPLPEDDPLAANAVRDFRDLAALRDGSP